MTHINKKDLEGFDNLMNAIRKESRDVHRKIGEAATEAQGLALSRFNSRALPNLSRRGERTSGLSGSIRRRQLKKSNTYSAYKVSAGGGSNMLAVYAEFGTRTKRINLTGIRDMFKSKGAAYARQFKGGNNKRNFTHLNATPYFFSSIWDVYRPLPRKLTKEFRKALRASKR